MFLLVVYGSLGFTISYAKSRFASNFIELCFMTRLLQVLNLFQIVALQGKNQTGERIFPSTIYTVSVYQFKKFPTYFSSVPSNVNTLVNVNWKIWFGFLFYNRFITLERCKIPDSIKFSKRVKLDRERVNVFRLSLKFLESRACVNMPVGITNNKFIFFLRLGWSTAIFFCDQKRAKNWWRYFVIIGS